MEGYCLSMQNALHCLFVFPLCHTHTSGGSSLAISIPPRYISLALSFAFSHFSFNLWLSAILLTLLLWLWPLLFKWNVVVFALWVLFCSFGHYTYRLTQCTHHCHCKDYRHGCSFWIQSNVDPKKYSPQISPVLTQPSNSVILRSIQGEFWKKKKSILTLV